MDVGGATGIIGAHVLAFARWLRTVGDDVSFVSVDEATVHVVRVEGDREIVGTARLVQPLQLSFQRAYDDLRRAVERADADATGGAGAARTTAVDEVPLEA